MQRKRDIRPVSRFALSIALPLSLILLSSGCEHKSVDSYLAAGDQAMQSTRLADAETAYQAAAKLAPGDPRVHVALGNLYIFEQKPGPAALEYMKVIELDTKNAAAHAALGSVYGSQGQLPLAEAQYRAAVALDPAKTAYRLSLGTVLQKESKLGDAEAQFRTAIGLEPKNAHAHLALASVLAAEPNRQAEADSEYAQVKALDPSLMPGTASASAAPPPTSPETTPSSTLPPTTVASAPPGPAKPIRDIDRRFSLTHDSPVYETPSDAARVIAQVHRSKSVHVTGIGGPWFRIVMKNGTVGFIPVSAAE
jgi:tetratricopeptide (TPR) repeat protein